MKYAYYTTFILLMFCANSWTQNHKQFIDTLTSLEVASTYASMYSDVFITRVSYDRDQLLFDYVDTNNLDNHIGETVSYFGRNTKFLKDTLIELVELQTITFNYSKTNKEIADVLVDQITKRLDGGESYWEVRQKYEHTSAEFTSRPEYVDEVNEGIILTKDLVNDKPYQIVESDKEKAIIIVKSNPYLNPSFVVISYNSLSR